MSAPRNHGTYDEDDYPANEQLRQQPQRVLADEIATIEARLIAKATTFLMLNAAALIGAIATGIGAYYALDKRVTLTETRIDINTQRIERLISEDNAIRSEIRENQTTIIQQNNNLATFLRQHDSNTASEISRQHR